MRQNPALIETHRAVLGEIKGAAGLAYVLGSMSNSFRSAQQACHWRCRGSSDSTLSPATPIRRRTEPVPVAPTTKAGCVPPPFQAIGCAKDLEGFAALYAQVRQSKVEAWADDLVAISEDRDS